MKLNYDTIRELLLQIEENTDLENVLEYDRNNTDQDTFYTLIKLKEAGFINSVEVNTWIGIVHIQVKSLTWEGHEFLNTIRDPKVFKETKNQIGKLASVSLDVLGKVATEIIKNKLGLWFFHLVSII